MKTKTNRKLSFLFFLFALIFQSSCSFSESDRKVSLGDGMVVSTIHALTEFNKISLGGAFNVTLKQGNTPEVIVETDENLQDLVDVEVRGKTLSVSHVGKVGIKPTKMNLIITYPHLKAISVGGACKIKADDLIESESLDLKISGAAVISLSIVTELLNTEIAGASSIKFQGEAHEHYISLSGASSLDAKNLITKTSRITIGGAGSASVNATQKLIANISGVGSIKYYGNPLETEFKKSGMGNIYSAE